MASKWLKCCIVFGLGVAYFSLTAFGLCNDAFWIAESGTSSECMNSMMSWLQIDLHEPLSMVSPAAPTLVSHHLSSPGTEAAIHLDPPSREPYHFAQPMTDMHRSQFGQDKALEPLLSQIKNGFFVESGAHDGEAISNTVYYESFG